MRTYVYSSLLLCLTLARCGHDDKKRKEMDNVESKETDENNAPECYQKAAHKKKKLSNSDNLYRMTMEMVDDNDDQTPTQNIVIYHGCRDNQSVDPVYASYTAINCKSALWIVRKINNFINLNMPIVKSTFDTDLVQFASDVQSQIDRFISILLNFLEKIGYSSFYIDKSVLKALVSFKIKISLMGSRINGVETGFIKTQEEIIELLLVEIVELQRYSSVHCEYTTVRTSAIPEYFNIWVFVDGPAEDDMSIEAFLRITANTGMEPDGPLKNCHARQILLEHIVEISGTDPISLMVLNVMSDEGGRDGDMITIRQIVNQMLGSYDVDIISWYHDSVLSAIMKLLCHAALMSENALSDVAKNAIEEINKKIMADNDALPAYVTEGFALLRENVDTKDLNSYYDTLRDIHVKPSTDRMTVLVDQLLERILQHFDLITCAEKFLKHLRGENDKYYMPGSHNRNTSLADYTRADESAYATKEFKPTACEFVVNIYIKAIRMSHPDARDVDRNITRAMKSILDYCILAIQYEHDNWHLVRTAYDVAVLLINQPLFHKVKKGIPFLYKRLMNRVMSELNVYRTKYCRTTTHEYLAIGKNVMLSKDGNAVRGNMQNFFFERYGVTLKMPKASSLVHDYDRYFRVDYLYENYVVKSDVVKQYSNVVRVYWNLRLLSVDEVIAELTNSTLDPSNVYALYDVYYKIFLAVIFHEARRALVGSDYRSLVSEWAILTTAFDFNDYLDVFPDGLAALKTDLSTIFSFPYTRSDPNDTLTMEVSEMDAVNKLQKAMLDVEVKFAQSNVVIKDDIVEQPSTSNRTSLEGFTFLAVLDNEVNVLVRDFNKEFQQLRRFY